MQSIPPPRGPASEEATVSIESRSAEGFDMSAKSGTETFDDLVRSTLPSLVREVTSQGGRLYRSIMARVEQPLLRHALELCGGNQLKAAKLLGINRNTLRKRLWLLGLLPAGAGGSKAGATARPA